MKTSNLNVNHGGVSYVGYAYTALPLPAALVAAAAQIDLEADSARAAVVPDPLRALEHAQAAAEAKAFAASGYVGEIPPYVKAWADAAALNPQAATDSIIAEADAWQAAMLAIRTARLSGKQGVLNATSHAVAENIADTAIEAIRACIVGVGNA